MGAFELGDDGAVAFAVFGRAHVEGGAVVVLEDPTCEVRVGGSAPTFLDLFEQALRLLQRVQPPANGLRCGFGGGDLLGQSSRPVLAGARAGLSGEDVGSLLDS